MTDTDLLPLIRFILDRFYGQVPEDKMLINAISDWRRSNVSSNSEAL